MYLFPTKKELDVLWSELDPKQRFLRAARQVIDCACELGDSMGGFYFDSQDMDMIMEDCVMPYFDEIEDDIISMKRDINGFRMSRKQRRDIDDIDDYSEVELGEKVEWDEI